MKIYNINSLDRSILPLLGGVQSIQPTDSWNAYSVDSFSINGCSKTGKSLFVKYYLNGVYITGEMKRISFRPTVSEACGNIAVKINGNSYNVGKWEAV